MEYKKGDVVQITHNHTGHGLEIGTELTIEDTHVDGDDEAYYAMGWYFEEDECMKIR